MTTLYRLTRDLPADEPGNQFPRDLDAGELLYRCTAPYAASLNGDDGVMLTEDPDGGYPGYEVPRSAVEEAPGDSGPPPAAAAYDEAAHAIFHDQHCRCGHRKGVHAGRDADGRCVLRRCGCAQFEADGVPPVMGDGELRDEQADAASAARAARDAREAWNDPDGEA